jgi:pyruvate/2-oxoglutarate/acetoin dehydrogenase E1 component
MMLYKDYIKESMTWLGQQEDTCVVGYNTKYSHAGGSLSGFPNERIIEMPLAEALMTGVAIGMSLDGLIPILWLERMDFMTLAMDQIVNHLDKIKALSDGIHAPAVIIRACVGNKHTPLLTGPTHAQDFSKAFREMVSLPVIQLKWSSSIMLEYEKAYWRAKNERQSTLLVEYKDLYST